MLTDQWFVAMSKPAPARIRSGRASRSSSCASTRSASGLVDRSGEPDACASCPANGSTPTTTGSKTSRTGASRASSGGATRSRRGTTTTATSTSRATRTKRARRRARLGREPASFARDDDVLDTWFSSALWCRSRRSAGRRRRSELRHVPALVGARHRLRHHLLLGRADDHDDDALHRQGAVPRRLHQRASCATRRARRCRSRRATCSTRST